MGSKLSGLLAEIFMDRIESQIILSSNINFYSRYVDDTLILVRNKPEADEVLNKFNMAHSRLKFEVEHPKENQISLLDFTLRIVDGATSISPYTKPARSSIFLHADSALPTSVSNCTILNEWKRIRHRCDNHETKITERKKFICKLRENGHIKIPRLQLNENRSSMDPGRDTRCFYLTVPFVSEAIDTGIKRALKPLGLCVRLSHKGRPLSQHFNLRERVGSPNVICRLSNCPTKNKLCFASMVVYKAECQSCLSTYIGSTKKFLHLRLKEHQSMKNSCIHKHQRICGGLWNYSILSKCKSIPDMRIKEALIIKQENPSLNTKEDLFSISNVSLL
jgi:hypothetical protein